MQFRLHPAHVVLNCWRGSRALGHNYVGTEHVLLALFCDDGFAARILTGLGAEHDTFKSQVIQRLSGFATPEP